MDQNRDNIYKKRVWLYALPTVVCMLSTVMWSVSPLQLDDFWFLLDTSPADGFWSRLCATVSRCVENCQTCDTARLANLISGPLLVAPHYIFGVLSGVMLFVGIRAAAELSGCEPGGVGSYVVMGVVIIFLPWFDFMYSVMFTLNYVWAMAVVLSAAQLIIRSDGDKCDGHSRAKSLGGWLLCLAAGWMHEGWSVPLLCGLAVWGLTKTGKVSRKSKLLMGAMIIGVGLILASPTIWHRSGNELAGFGKFTLWEGMVNGVIGGGIAAVYLILVAATVLVRRWRKAIWGNRDTASRSLLWLVAVAVSVVIFCRFYVGARTGWAMEVYALIGGVQLLKEMGCRCGLWLGRSVKAFISAVCIANLVWAVAEQADYNREEAQILKMYEESADGVIYFDNMLPHLSGSLFKSSMRQFNERVPLTDFSKYHGGEKMLRILPEKLRGFSPSRAKASGKLPGGYIYNGCFVVAGNVEIATNYLIWQPEGGKEIASRFKSSEFSDEGGNEWRLLTPHFRTLGDKRDIVDVRRPE